MSRRVPGGDNHFRRRIAQSLLAGIFVIAGADAYKSPESKAQHARAVIDPMLAVLPKDSATDVQLVKLNAATQVVAGAMLALEVLPRLAAGALSSSMVLTTLGGYRFWEVEDEKERRRHLIQLLKNAAIVGGLIATL